MKRNLDCRSVTAVKVQGREEKRGEEAGILVVGERAPKSGRGEDVKTTKNKLQYYIT